MIAIPAKAVEEPSEDDDERFTTEWSFQRFVPGQYILEADDKFIGSSFSPLFSGSEVKDPKFEKEHPRNPDGKFRDKNSSPSAKKSNNTPPHDELLPHFNDGESELNRSVEFVSDELVDDGESELNGSVSDELVDDSPIMKMVMPNLTMSYLVPEKEDIKKIFPTDRFSPEFVSIVQSRFEELDKVTEWDELSDLFKETVEDEIYFAEYPDIFTASVDDVDFTKESILQLVSEVNKKMKESDVVYRMPLKKLFKDKGIFEGFLNDPRIKTQFETGKSGGLLDNDYRNEVEHYLLGTTEEIELKDRPVYAELAPAEVPFKNLKSRMYGDFGFVLSEDAKKRATFTLGDSLDYYDWGGNDRYLSFTNAIPFRSSPLAGLSNGIHEVKTMLDFSKGLGMKDFNEDENDRDEEGYTVGYGKRDTYIEAQVWGGVDLSKGDVVKFIASKESLKDLTLTLGDVNYLRFLNMLKSYNISLEVVK